PVTRSFSEGTHTMVAELLGDDLFSENNKFYKTIRVVDKPKISLVGARNSPLGQVVEELYDVDWSTTLPDDLSSYYTVILDGVGDTDTDAITDFLDEGNGLVVFGGQNSFELGPSTELMSILPVYPGRGDIKAKPDLNAVILADISSSDERAVAKAYTIDVLDQFKQNDNLGVVAFAQEAFVVSQLSRVFQKDMPQLKDEIKKLGYRCSVDSRYVCSRFDLGFDLAIKQLSGVGGKKYIFLLTDGRFGPANRNPPWTLINELRAQNIQVIPVVTIPVTKDLLERFHTIDNLVLWKSGLNFMEVLSERTSIDEYGGTVIKPTENALPQVAIITGKRQLDAENGQTDKGLFVFDSSHFITRDVGLTAKLYGNNQVVPRSSGKLLVSTADGMPILVVGYYGLGRVAVMATDNGQSWAPELFKDKDNSELVSKTVNWAIADPERKKESYVLISDSRIDQQTEITVKSPAPPTFGNLIFEKSGEIYTGTFTPEEIGFQEILSQRFAVNYDVELTKFGVRSDMGELMARTGGKVFIDADPDQIEKEVRQQAVRLITEKTVWRWPLIAFALGLLLLEIIVRRLIQYKNA
ncbi:MAG: glutamine amidotransferase, partial [Nanoarchaeota archaeon]